MSEITEDQPAPQDWKMEANKVYQSVGPDGTEIAVMSWETWVNMNTGIESLRQALSNQSRLLKEREADYDAAVRRLADVTTRLENLRAVRREELRKDIEGQLNIPSQG